MLQVVSRGVCVSLGICLGESSLLRDQVTGSEGQLPSGPPQLLHLSRCPERLGVIPEMLF